MNNERFIELITKELTGELSPDEMSELQTLMKSDPFYAKQRNTFRMFWAKDHANEFDDDALFKRVTEKIRLQEPDFNLEKEAQTKRKLLPFIWKAAAVFLIATSAFLLYRINWTGGLPKADMQLVRTLKGERKMIVLPDGTKVAINVDSKLSFPSAFQDSTREVSLTGEAFFDVHEDHKHPFIIHTRKLAIRVLGTAFNVKAYQNDKFSETTLIRGIIQVRLTDRPNDQITLRPTEKLVVNYLTPVAKESKVTLVKNNTLPEVTYLQKNDTTVVETSWLQNKLIFKNQDFETITNSLSRRYNVSIQFENQLEKDLRFTGVFEKETVTEILNALQLTENFKYKIVNEKILIY